MSGQNNVTQRGYGSSIAIIGTEGTGKTVLTAVLAKRLSSKDSVAFLNPQGPTTLKHVEKVWSILQGEDWPEGNPAGELFQLHWNLEVEGKKNSEVRFIEAPGQDFRTLFEGEQYGREQDATLKTLGDYCRNADIVMFLINLQNFIGEKNAERRSSNEAAIKAAMDCLGKDGGSRRFCIVITQADLMQAEAEKAGGWANLLATYLPNLHGGYLRHGKAQVFPVAAVSETTLREDANGRVIRVPRQGFASQGLESLTEWLLAAITPPPMLRQERQHRPQPSPKPVQQAQPAQPAPRPPQPAHQPVASGRSDLASCLLPIVLGVLGILILPQMCTETVTVRGRPDTLWEEIVGAPDEVVNQADITGVIIGVIIFIIIGVLVGIHIDKQRSR